MPAGDSPAGPYRLAWPPAVRESVLDYGRWARAARLSVSFAADLELAEARLRADPTAWGDPLYDLHALGLICHRGHSAFLYLYFFVNESHRTVFIQRVEANPFGPLA